MSVRLKVILILSAIILFYIAAHYGIQQLVVFPSFVELERAEATKDMQRCVEAIRREIYHLDTFCYDWARWDDTYRFVVDGNKDYINANLVVETFTENNLNLIYVVNTNGKVVWGQVHDVKTEELMQIREFPPKMFPQDHPLLKHDNVDGAIAGVFMTDKGPMLVSSRPIITSNGEGPIRGTLIMARFLNADAVRTLVEQTRVRFELWPLQGKSIPEEEQGIPSLIARGGPFLISEHDQYILHAYATFPDIRETPALLIRADIPRDITEKGMSSLRFAMFSILVSSLIVLLTIWLLLEWTVLSRVGRLSTSVSEIGASGDLSARVSMRGKDEVSRLAANINRMLDGLERAELALRQSEEQLRHSQKMEAVGRLAGGMAHDFNNLLTAITGYCEFLLEELDPADPRRTEVQGIQSAAERAASLIRQLLAFGRRQVLQPKVVNLNAVVADMDNMLRRLIGEDIELVTRLDSALGCVNADPGQIEQVIMNLAVNARDAMSRGGTLAIETTNVDLDETYAHKRVVVKPGSYVMLAVSDTGQGMDQETQAHMFEPFFTTKEKGKGTGLGLSTVYGIVKQSGGYIWVYSEIGHGTTFKIYLPCVEGTAETTETRATLAAAPPQQGSETILIVEDDAKVRTLVHKMLEKNKYTVIEASNGSEALALCEQFKGPIHLVLTDVVMPQMSGAQLVSRLTAVRPEIKVLYMSGYTDDAIVHHGVLEPGIAFIGKPFNAESLARKVREVLDAPRVA